MSQDPRWADCSIDWSGVDTVAKITHIPTGAYVEPNASVIRDGQDIRGEMLEQLFSNVPKT